MSEGARLHEHGPTIDLPFNGKAKIIIVSDLHVGAKMSRWDLFEEMVLKPHAEDPNTLFLMNGDMINCIAPGDPRFRLSETHEMFTKGDNTHQQETHFYIKLLQKYRIHPDRLLGHVIGNHEDSALKHNNYDPFIDICKDLRSPFLGIDGFLKVNFRMGGGTRLPIVIYYHHGMGGGSRRKGSGAQLEKYINYSFPYRGVDIYAFAHEHALADDRVVVQRPNWAQKGVQRKEIIYVNSGTYMAEEGYARRKMYSPKPMGHIEINIQHRRRRSNGRSNHGLKLDVHKPTWQPIGMEMDRPQGADVTEAHRALLTV